MFWLILFVAVWGIVHSFLASLSFKDFLRRLVGNGFIKFYRLLYNLFAVVSLAPIFYLMISLPDQMLYQFPSPWSFLLRAGQGIAILLLLVAVLQTDALSFMGLRQLFEEEVKSNLVTNGFYRFVRHPLYTFGLLILWLSPSMTVNTFIVYAALTVYILIGIFFEERKLQREFGQQYASYKAVTPMLVPSLSKIGAQRRISVEKWNGTNNSPGPS